MAITSIKTGSSFKNLQKYNDFVAGYPAVMAAPTATAGNASASVAFTAQAGATSYTALSTPGSFTGTGSSSPVTVSGLSNGTAYTFQVRATNSVGTGAYSAASNSVTPLDPAAFVSIASIAGSGSSITFSSIPSTYAHLQLRCYYQDTYAPGTVGSTLLQLRFNGVSSAQYRYHTLKGNASVVDTNGTSNAQAQIFIYNAGVYQPSSNMVGASIIDIPDYTSTTRNKTVRYFAGDSLNNTSSDNGIVLGAGLWESTSAITSITLLAGSTAFSSDSVFSLYGIKGA